MKTYNAPIVAIIGPTAIGKTALSFEIARKYKGEIVSVDSMQIYKYMDIGTAKPSRQEQRQFRHHLIDVVYPDEDYNAGRYVRDTAEALDDILKRKKLPLLVGGTGLYLKALLQGLSVIETIPDTIREHFLRRLEQKGNAILHEELRHVDPEAARRIHPNDTQRLLRGLEIYHATGKTWTEYITRDQSTPLLTNVLLIGLSIDREKLYRRINKRVEIMLATGLIEEVEQLLNRGYSPELKSMQSIGYRHIGNYLRGKWPLEKAKELLGRDTRRYAKRQFTWFNQVDGIVWLEPTDHESVMAAIDAFIEKQSARGSTNQ